MSILQIIANFLTVFPTIKQSWAGNEKGSRESYIYEHIFGPLVVAAIALEFHQTIGLMFFETTGILQNIAYYYINYMPDVSIIHMCIFIVLTVTHLIWKELIKDRLKHGYFNTANIIERVYGLYLAGQLLWVFS